MATLLKCYCSYFKGTVLANKHIMRSLHMLKRDFASAVNQSYSRRICFTRAATFRLKSQFENKFVRINQSCKCYSKKAEDDDDFKSWVKQIEKDFQKMPEMSVDRTQNNTESNVDDKSVMLDDFDDLENLEKRGFTSEEIIELLKKSKKLDDEFFSEGSSSDENDAESDVESSSSDSDTEKQDKTKSRNDEIKSDSRSSNELDSKLVTEDWAVVKMRDKAAGKEWSEIEIEDFVNIAEIESDVEQEWIPPVSLKRGKTGVFEVEELVTVLRHANAVDIVTLRIPHHLDFADYMVIASAKSHRHMLAIAGDIRWIYKRRMTSQDKHFQLEGEESDWHAVDLGNIILHVFMPKVRELYDLETLWTVGSKFDPQCMKQEDPYTFSADELPWLKELEQASKDSKQASTESEKADLKN